MWPADAGVAGESQSFGDARPDGVQIHVGHGRRQRPFVAQQLDLESPLPEPTLARILGIGGARQRLGQQDEALLNPRLAMLE